MNSELCINSSRDAILARIRQSHPDPAPLPDVPMYDIGGDPVDNFLRKLAAFDGKALRFPDRDSALRWLDANIDLEGKVVFSSLPDWQGNLPLDKVADPHAAHVIDTCVARGLMGVGEMGAVWVTDESLGKGACALMATDLYLLLDQATILPGMHQAYAALDLRAQPYGSFFTGPSATADIEAVRVTGAQGPVTLTVLLHQ